MLYILALEPFLRRLKANPVLRGLTLPRSSEIARYTAYTDDVGMFITSSSEVEKVSKEIGRYEAVTVLHSHIIHMQPYIFTSGNIFNTIRTSGHSCLEIYISHFIERVVCER